MESKLPNPTPAEIKRGCENAQKQWSPQVRETRRQGANKEPPWTPPVISSIILEEIQWEFFEE